MSIELSPIILALFSSFLFSLGVQFQHIGLSVINSKTGTAISITTAACIYWLLSPFFGSAFGVWWLGEDLRGKLHLIHVV